ncbi:GTP-binding protein HSR1-related protein [Thalassoporum mexicanum PCC 7367]|uniref:YcjF family protein n=1 Tax=Thalassoporum mexicanum TaxID=3457544 RepID=UPI00029FC6F1|nr:GTP-binding protein [Pseudanabaena sp. PCC 7367]AFY69242.1 GTP-binding protein HSR1-related protein [Pseudanabaena sp. PCC 7367]
MFRSGWLRLILLVIAVGLIGGLVLGLIDRLIQIYRLLAPTSPLLAGLVVLILLIVLVGLGIAGWIYLKTFQRQSRPKIEPKVSTDKVEAATENLAAVQKLVQQIQDQVARKALEDRTTELLADLARQELKVVIFGVGSAGKTSLVNAMITAIQLDDWNKNADQPDLDQLGAVGAAMGTTQIGEVYGPIQWPDLELPIVVTDCPGILEAGVAGTDREKLARQLAADADLIIFVVDADLSRSEYEPLQALAQIGKRSILAFNKIDRYPKADRQVLLARLRQRVIGIIAPEDVVAIAARPSPVKLPSGETVVAQPKLTPLIERMAVILNQEGDSLVADNVLLQSQGVGDAAKLALTEQRKKEAEAVVERYQWFVVGAILATPLPVVDLLAAAAVNAQMVVAIAKVYGCQIDREKGKELAASLTKTLASLGVVRGTVEIVSTAISVTVVGYIVRAAVQSIAGAYLTRIAGYSFIEYFSRDQDWGDGGIAAVVQKQFQLNKRDDFIKAFVQEAFERFTQLSRQPPENEDDEAQP